MTERLLNTKKNGMLALLLTIALYLQSVIKLWNMTFLEFNVNNSTNDLYDCTFLTSTT